MEQPTIEICDCAAKYSIQKHGSDYALYFDRCNHKHGYNLAKISDCSSNCELEELERLLNRPSDKLARARAEIEKMSHCGVMRSMTMTTRANTAKEILKIIDGIANHN